MLELANNINTLLGVNEKLPGTFYGNPETMKIRMRMHDPCLNEASLATSIRDKTEALQKFFTKEGAPKEFKKTFKYGVFYNWCLQYTDLIEKSHKLKDLKH